MSKFMAELFAWIFACARGVGMLALAGAILLVLLMVASITLLTVYVSFRTTLLLAMIAGGA